MPRKPRTLHRISGLAVLCWLIVQPLSAIEFYKTTEDLIKEAPIVAHVKVLSFRENPGIGRTVDYTVALIESFKGTPPPTFDIRILQSARAISPGPFPDDVDTEWFVILGNRNSLGFYPLRSLTQGKIRISVDPQSQRKFLSQPVSGFQGQGRHVFDLDRMRGEMKSKGHYGGRK